LTPSSSRRWVSRASTGRRPAACRAAKRGDVPARDGRAHVGAAQHALLGRQGNGRQAELGLEVRHPHRHGRAAAPSRAVRLCDHLGPAGRLESVCHATRGEPPDGLHLGRPGRRPQHGWRRGGGQGRALGR
jgi:hypothetical protein